MLRNVVSIDINIVAGIFDSACGLEEAEAAGKTTLNKTPSHGGSLLLASHGDKFCHVALDSGFVGVGGRSHHGKETEMVQGGRSTRRRRNECSGPCL